VAEGCRVDSCVVSRQQPVILTLMDARNTIHGAPSPVGRLTESPCRCCGTHTRPRS
jgi:hypothetical protein